VSNIRAALDEVVTQYRVSFEIPDPGQIHAMLGVIAANMSKDDKPVWLIFVGPPSSGKSDPMRYLAHLPSVHFASEVTAGGLLSCSPARGRGRQGTGGMLTSIGDFGILAVSDLSPTLCLGDDRLAQFLSMMREVYDGKVIRYGGQDGGMKRVWTGKLGFLAAATGDIDRHHSVINTLGDRYFYFRIPQGDVRAKMERARKRSDNKKSIEAALTALFNLLPANLGVELADETEQTLQTLAEFVAVARTAVVREPRNRTIEETPVSEEPTRLYLSFRSLFKGMARIGLSDTEAMAITSKIALDSLPRARLTIIKEALALGDLTVAQIRSGPYPLSLTTTHRALEELVEYRILTKVGENGVAAHYSPAPLLTASAAALPDGTFSDIFLISWLSSIGGGASEAAGMPDPLSEKVGGGLFDPIEPTEG
jgi:hypothetical protein